MAIRQSILRIITLEPGLRSKSDGWDCESGHMIRQWKEIGLCGAPRHPCYPTPMHAIGDGWRLMAPPSFIKDYVPDVDAWEWWFEKFGENETV